MSISLANVLPTTFRLPGAAAIGRASATTTHSLGRWRLVWDRQLHRAHALGKPLVLGSLTRPYAPRSAAGRRGRWLLERLTNLQDVELAITTTSPTILAELEQLKRLDQRHAVTVDMLVPALDPHRARRVLPLAGPPSQCLDALARLADSGLTTRLIIPIRSAINDTTAVLEPLCAAALARGAFDVLGRMRRGPAWLPWGWEASSRQGNDQRNDPRRIGLVRLQRLRLAHGFPQNCPGWG